MPATRTLYEILDVPPDASGNDVEQGYQRAQETFGGDALASYALFTPEEAERARREIEMAYAVLRHPAARAAYDAALSAAPDKGAATLTFTTTFQMPTSGSTSFSDGSVVAAPAAETEPTAERRQNTGRFVRIAAPVEDIPAAAALPPPAPEAAPEPVVVTAQQPVVEEPPPEPADLPPMPPAAPVVETAPTAPIVLLPTPPPTTAPPPTSSTPALATQPPADAPRFRRVRADDATVSNQVARPSMATLPPLPAEGTRDSTLPEEGEINGSVLQRLRETRGLTLRQVSEVTKLSVHYLKAMETNQFADLPSRVYMRGFLIQLARAYRVPTERLAQGYLAFADRYRNQLK